MMTNGSVAASHRRSSRSAALVLRNTIAVMLGRLAQPSARAYSQLLHQVQEPVPALKITGTHAFPCRCSPWHTAARTVPMRCLSTSNVALTSSVSDQGQVRTVADLQVAVHEKGHLMRSHLSCVHRYAWPSLVLVG